MVSYGTGNKNTATGYNDLITRPQEKKVEVGQTLRRCDSADVNNASVRRQLQEK